MPRPTGFNQTLCADIDGFSLHAAVRCGADERKALAQLCRYITRPALANERVQCNVAVQVVLKLKTPWRDGTPRLVMSPLEFMQRRQRGPCELLLRSGELAAVNVAEGSASDGQSLELTGEQPTFNLRHPRSVGHGRQSPAIDRRAPPPAGWRLEIIAGILEQPVTEKTLTHLGLQACAPPRAPARGQAQQAA